MYLKLEGDRVADAAFLGKGCAISTASASLMTEAIRGKTEAEVERLFEAFHAMVTGKAVPAGVALGKLSALAGVAAYPVRVKCATLPWHTMKGALAGARQPVSTE